MLQETKKPSWDPFDLKKILPSYFDEHCAFLATNNSAGGCLLVWRRCYSLSNSWATQNSISAFLSNSRSNTSFLITSVYGPQSTVAKFNFINELLLLPRPPNVPWILGGDFNLIRWLVDRPSCNPDWNLMDSFNDAIRRLQLFDVPLQSRKYIWSNKQPSPILSKIDRLFLSPPFLMAFQRIVLSSGTMVTSDHVPLILSCSQHATRKPPNRMELFRLKYQGFKDLTQETFSSPPQAVIDDPISIFSSKLDNLHSRLRIWHNKNFARQDSFLENCQIFISFFDSLEEHRALTPLEFFLRIKVRERTYEIANIEEIRWYQRARCKWLSHGDRNTKFFHALASSRARTKAITRIVHQGADLTSQSQIMAAFVDHHKHLMGTRQHQEWLDLSSMYDQRHDLAGLASPFTESEVLHAVNNLASNKASGPDGLPNEFLKLSFGSLKLDIMKILQSFFLEEFDLSSINEARLVLLPKVDVPLAVTDYRPISVINLIPKLISKLLANRIKTFMPDLISEHQTTFIQDQFIAENFLATREALYHVH